LAIAGEAAEVLVQLEALRETGCAERVTLGEANL
jgi:hypothetical protein